MGQDTNTSAYGYLGYATWGVYCNGSICGGTQAWTNTSDARLKTDVRDLEADEGLATVLKLRPVSFDWLDAKQRTRQGRQIGFIAQDVEKVMPMLVSHPGTPTTIELEDGTRKTINDTEVMSYATVVVPLVKAVQELKAANDNLKADNDNLRAELHETINSQDRQIEELRRELNGFTAAH